MNLGNLFLDKQRHKVVSSSLKHGGPHLAVSLRGRNENYGTDGQEGPEKEDTVGLLRTSAFYAFTHPACVGKHWLTSE